MSVQIKLNRRLVWRYGVACLVLLVLGTGCTHQMEVTNLSKYYTAPLSGVPFDICVEPFRGANEEAIYFTAVVNGLRVHPHVGRVRVGRVPDEDELSIFNPSHVISLKIDPEYKGDSDNFVITWPGCYIFTCAWRGYDYHINIETSVRVSASPHAEAFLSGRGLRTIELSRTIETDFDLRHCDYGRGFWSGSGWWMPGWGLHNIIVGIFYTEYEPKATKPFHYAADGTYGEYAANEIVKLLVSCGAEEYAKQQISSK